MAAPARAGALRPGVFLDRDGVLNRAVVRDGRPYPPAGLHELEIPDGVAEACRLLAAAGAALVVVTNQPDIARGRTAAAAVDAVNDRLRAVLAIDDFRVCPHDDADRCACRKPRPGLIEQGARAHGIDLSRSVMVGDRWRDVGAGEAAGCKTVFINHNYRERQPVAPDFVCASLRGAVPFILSVLAGRPGPVRPQP